MQNSAGNIFVIVPSYEIMLRRHTWLVTCHQANVLVFVSLDSNFQLTAAVYLNCISADGFEHFQNFAVVKQCTVEFRWKPEQECYS
jgi:hypothetical protein